MIKMEHLLEAICRGGTYCATYCEWCARTHYKDNGTGLGDYEEGELEELRKNSKEKPDEYIANYEADAISYGDFCGKQIVWGCSCNEKSLQPYVDHYWGHARILSEFLKSRTKEEANTARVRATMLEAIGKNAVEASEYIEGGWNSNPDPVGDVKKAVEAIKKQTGC